MLYDAAAAALLKFYLMDLLTDNFWIFFKSKLEIAQKIMHTLYSILKTSVVLSLLIDIIKAVLVGWIIISLSL